MPVDVTFDEITRNEIFFEGWIDDTLWVDEDCFDDVISMATVFR